MTLLLDDDESQTMSPPTKAPRTHEPPSAPIFHRMGGNGLAKMDALAYGTPVVKIIDGAQPVQKRARTSTPSAEHASVSGGGSTPQDQTQPKRLHAVSPADSTPKASSPTLPATVPHNGGRSESAATLASPAARTPASLSQSEDVSRTLVLEEAAEKSTAAKSSTPAVKQQMKLSDFFGKMACKRPPSA